MNHEAWLVAASGVFAQYLTDLNGVSNKDTRAMFVANDYHRGWLAYRTLLELGHIISSDTVSDLNWYAQDLAYKPRYREDMPPIPQGVQESGGVITCDEILGSEVYVYSYSDGLFQLVGALDDTVHTSGDYVLVARSGSSVGLPSAFITIS